MCVEKRKHESWLFTPSSPASPGAYRHEPFQMIVNGYDLLDVDGNLQVALLHLPNSSYPVSRIMHFNTRGSYSNRTVRHDQHVFKAQVKLVHPRSNHTT